VLLLSGLLGKEAVEGGDEARHGTESCAHDRGEEDRVLRQLPREGVEHDGQEPEVVECGDTFAHAGSRPGQVSGDTDGELLESREDVAGNINVPAQLVDSHHGAGHAREEREVEEHADGGEEHRDVASPDLQYE